MRKIKNIPILIIVLLSLIVFATSVSSDESFDIPDISEGSKAFDAMNELLLNNDYYSGFVEEYGGGYIEDKTLFVYYKYGLDETVVNNLANEETLQEYSIVFLPSEYSYNQLVNMMEKIWNEKIEHENDSDYWTSKICAIGVNQTENCLDVFVEVCTDTQLLEIKNYLNDYPIKYILSDGYTVERQTTTIHPGEGIYINGTSSISIGFRCKKSGNKGFLTTIHSNSTGSTITYNTHNIGTVTASVDDGYADFSFVKLNSSYEVSLKPKGISSYQLQSSNYATTLPVNHTVYFAGRTQYGVVTGVVKYTNYMIGYGSDWLVCSYSAYSGDSGGCVFTKQNGNYVVLSIHNGTVYDNSTQMTLSYSTKYTTIINQYYSDIVIY